MKRSTRTKQSKTTYKVLSALAMFLTWWVLSVLVGKSYIIPSPPLVLSAMNEIIKTQVFYVSLFSTMIRTFICMCLSMIIGIILGILAGYFESVKAFLAPFMRAIKTLPTIVVIVYAIIWLPGNLAPIMVTALITLPIVYANVLEGIENISTELDEVFVVYDISERKRMRFLIWPSLLPYVKAALVNITSLGLKVMIASEVLSQTQPSIGKSFQLAKINLQTEVVFAWAIVTICLALGLEYLLKRIIFGQKIF